MSLIGGEEALALQLGLHPIFHRLRGLSDNKVFNKGREVAEDLRERWETSDSPLVQRIQVRTTFVHIFLPTRTYRERRRNDSTFEELLCPSSAPEFSRRWWER